MSTKSGQLHMISEMSPTDKLLAFVVLEIAVLTSSNLYAMRNLMMCSISWHFTLPIYVAGFDIHAIGHSHLMRFINLHPEFDFHRLIANHSWNAHRRSCMFSPHAENTRKRIRIGVHYLSLIMESSSDL